MTRRRGPCPLQALAAFALAALMAAAGAPVWAACGDRLPLKARQQVDGTGVQIVFAPRAWPIPVGQHFAIDVDVCVPPGAAAPAELRVDADMPVHRHGMNYRATVQPLGDGRFVAEGLMFHMPGRWRFIFDLGTQAGRLGRLTHEVAVE